MFSLLRRLWVRKTQRANWVIIVDNHKVLWDQMQAVVDVTLASGELGA